MPWQLLFGGEVLLAHLVDDTAIVIYEEAAAFAAKVRYGILSKLIASEQTTRDELADDLADDAQIPIEDSERLAIALHHYHLPKLDDDQYLEYDSRSGDVVRWKDPATIEASLEMV